MRFRSILYCLGRSNASYYDPSIIHPGVHAEHFSYLVYQVFYYHWWAHTYWLTVCYFFKHQFKAFLKKTAIEVIGLWSVPIWFVIDIFLPFWTLYCYLDPIFYRSVNTIKWKNDWYVTSWAQYYVFYRYFKPVRYFFYLKIYWWEFFWFLKQLWEIWLDIFDEPGGPREIAMENAAREWDWAVERAIRLGKPIPQRSKEHIKSKVIFNKKYYYPDKLDYYLNWRVNYKMFKFNMIHYKNKSPWL